MTTTDTAVAEAVLHVQIQQFYAAQMQLLDSGKAEDWAQTFTEDGVFAANAHPEPAEGRAVIAATARKATDEYAAKGIQRRHWLGMVNVEQRGADEVFAQCYALVIETPRGGQAKLHVSTRCDDLLVRTEGRWQVRHRQVYRDDLS
ncbi:nuclear transport factor 2 family protein [Streptomyces sp. NPDC051658]|uniref:nuclear transport factor 2 family protein n=1 Tax=unclassified Streptomyces TaxID=2593676 RepID=UPI00224E8CCA|nr:nuclear transport factor 2 family protein [Streptomyces sp. NBC_00893]MCX4851917.1 nuclear transport factor 2 family protein [Streptomyces sp. NBC_00893]